MESLTASVALEAEIDDCHRRRRSGDILMSTVASNAEGFGYHQIVVHPFVEAFDGELNRLTNVLSNHRLAIKSSAEALLNNVDGLSQRRNKISDTTVLKEIRETRKQVNILQNETLRINAEATKNEKEIHRIALLADTKLVLTSCVDQSKRRFCKEPWADKFSTGHIVKILSDIFSLIQDIEDRGERIDDKWIAPASFERVTTKYWVSDKNLAEVLLKSAGELPILVYGKSGLLIENPKDPSEGKDEFWKSMASPISSVYFDSENMDLYEERIKRSEGAQLFRVRWYGDKPKNDEVIFLELKTHHECWIDKKSVKERVGIVQRNMLTLMDTLDGQWTSDFAKGLVAEASPDASKEEKETSTALLLNIRAIFCKLKLRPCVRTSYTRAVFQSSKNNNLRLTIDRDITVMDETSVHNEGSWCIEDNDVVPIKSFLKVPYGVFEVKVSDGENPLFIEALQESNAIIEVAKFSKFITGASLYNANNVNVLPWWAEDSLFEPIYKTRQNTSKENGVSNSLKGIDADMNQTGMSVTYVSGSDLTAIEEGLVINSDIRGATEKKGGKMNFFGMHSNTKIDRKPTIAPKSPARVEPKSFFANERTFIQWITVGSLFLLVSGIVSFMLQLPKIRTNHFSSSSLIHFALIFLK
jgi:SPX domain protein involved in polyphosphate accumulation